MKSVQTMLLGIGLMLFGGLAQIELVLMRINVGHAKFTLALSFGAALIMSIWGLAMLAVGYNSRDKETS